MFRVVPWVVWRVSKRNRDPPVSAAPLWVSVQIQGCVNLVPRVVVEMRTTNTSYGLGTRRDAATKPKGGDGERNP